MFPSLDSQAVVFGADQAIGDTGTRIFPDEKRFLDGRLILELNIARIE